MPKLNVFLGNFLSPLHHIKIVFEVVNNVNSVDNQVRCPRIEHFILNIFLYLSQSDIPR